MKIIFTFIFVCLLLVAAPMFLAIMINVFRAAREAIKNEKFFS